MPNNINVQNLIQQALGDGARSTKYDVMIALKTGDYESKNIAVLAKSTNFPSRQHQTIDFKYKGFNIPIRGQSKYTQTWECSFYLSDDHILKNRFEAWIEALDSIHNYIGDEYCKKERTLLLSNYTTDIKIFQQNFNDTETTAEYTLKNAFPVEIAPVQLSSDPPSTVLEFSVTFAYSHYELKSLQKGSIHETLVDKIINKLKNTANNLLEGVASNISGLFDNNLNAELDKNMAVLGYALGIDNETTIEDLVHGNYPEYNPGGWFDNLNTAIANKFGSAVDNTLGFLGDSFSSNLKSIRKK